MATPDHLLKRLGRLCPWGSLTSFSKPEEWVYSDNNSHTYSVADWRVEKPIFNEEHCIHCQFCWVYCPDTSIISKDKKFSHVDYVHCKGCGICAEVCPTNPKSLIMFIERTPDEEALANWPKKEKKSSRE